MSAVSVVINGVTYSNCPSVQIPKSGSGTAEFFEISDTTAAAGDVLATKYFYTSAGSKTQGSIATKTGDNLSASGLTVTVPSGYYASQATKTCSDANLVTGNIKSGVTIFGVSGSTNVVDTTIASSGAAAGQILNGYKAYVNGSLIEGNASVPTISQNSQTKVLTIQ